jgi:hypothetical protein
MKMSESNEEYTSIKTTRKGGGVLPHEVKAQLLLDIVTNPLYTVDQIAALPEREYKDYIVAYKNRFYYLLKLKRTDPKRFWALYSKANRSSALSGDYRDKAEEESDDEEPPSPSTRPPTPDTIVSTPPRRPKSNAKKTTNMSGSRAKITSPPAAASAFAYNTMFNTMEEAEATGMFSL